MFGFTKKTFISLLDLSSGRSSACNSCIAKLSDRMKCISLNNRPCQARATLVGINSNEPLYYPFTVSPNKCGGSCNTIDDLYGRACVPNKVKNMNVKVFNLMSGVNETRFLVQHESC